MVVMKGIKMDDHEYSETLKSIRHYSNLRFALLTLYSTATAGILSVVFGGSLQNIPPWGTEAFKFGGLLFSIVFLFFEILLSKYLNIMGEFINNRNNSHYPLLPDYGKNYVTWLFRILYLSIILFWINTILIKI